MWSQLSRKTRRNALRIVPFGVIWLLMAQVFLVSDYAATGSFSEVPETAIALDPGIYLFASLAVALVGCMIGAIELLYLNRRFAARTLATKLVGKTLIYAALLTGVILVTFPIAAAMEMNTSLTDGRVWQRLDAFFVSKTGLATGVQLTTSLVASLFYAEISEHMGPGVLMNFLTGRYHKPRVERRVFLFSDMKSSTSIAERLGHRQYFDLLRAYYAAMSDSIVNHGGEVYQYVGDEIVVSWPEHEGLRDSNCLRCVLSMKRALNRDSSRFLEAFGLVPDFKAGLQLGEVTTGEIGALKKQIVFSGDVLNQTARIQALCSGYDEEVLVGDELWARLDGKEEFEVRSLGHQVLRGKEQPVELFALDLEGVAA